MDFLTALNLPQVQSIAWKKHVRDLQKCKDTHLFPQALIAKFVELHNRADAQITHHLDKVTTLTDQPAQDQIDLMASCLSLSMAAQSLSICGAAQGLPMHKLIFDHVYEWTSHYSNAKRTRAADPSEHIALIEGHGKLSMNANEHFNWHFTHTTTEQAFGQEGQLPMYLRNLFYRYPADDAHREIRAAVEASFRENARKTWVVWEKVKVPTVVARP